MEALDLFMDAIKDKAPYDLLCLDIMMPRIDGLKLLKAIRVLEKQHQLQQDIYDRNMTGGAKAPDTSCRCLFQPGCVDLPSTSLHQKTEPDRGRMIPCQALSFDSVTI